MCLKKIGHFLRCWYRPQEIAFVFNGGLYKFSYTLVFRHSRLLSILKHKHFENAENIILDTLHTSNIGEALKNNYLFENNQLITDLKRKPLIEIKEQSFSKLRDISDLSFITDDKKKLSTYIYFDKGVMKEDDIFWIFDIISTQIIFYNAKDFPKSIHYIELLYPKMEMRFYVCE
ncbi:MAG: hypothetical protein IKW58_01315 [Alphaproteobacteria bacterium]|nr:hypothetical protein [Alphaproteobacteria bacterium]